MEIKLNLEEIAYLKTALRHQIEDYELEMLRAWLEQKEGLANLYRKYIDDYKKLMNRIQDKYEKYCKEKGEIPF